MEESDLKLVAPYNEPDILRRKFKRERVYYASKHRPYLSPKEGLSLEKSKTCGVLTAFERKEILNYPKIFWLGLNAEKPIPTDDPANNFGMDHEDGFLDTRINDQIVYRYQITKFLGRGNSSHVVRAYDHQEKREVALKIFRNRKKFVNMGLAELQLIKHLDHLDPTNIHNLVQFHGCFDFRRHLIFSTEVLAGDLLQYIEDLAREEKTILREDICNFTTSALKAIEFLARNDIVHLDIKPENMLLKNPKDVGSVKIVDFGSARYKGQEAKETYIQTR